MPQGVPMPPARAWRATRPGDLHGEQPKGELFGDPGPNIGYAATLMSQARDTLTVTPNERIDDVEKVVAQLAMRRATMFGRAPVMQDIDVARHILGLDRHQKLDAKLVEARTHALHNIAHEYPRQRAIVNEVPESLLRSNPDDLDPSEVFGSNGEYELMLSVFER